MRSISFAWEQEIVGWKTPTEFAVTARSALLSCHDGLIDVGCRLLQVIWTSSFDLFDVRATTCGGVDCLTDRYSVTYYDCVRLVEMIAPRTASGFVLVADHGHALCHVHLVERNYRGCRILVNPAGVARVIAIDCHLS